ncbi:MAG: MFS transporter, partial [Deltaproteobacteria bacterium]
MQASNVGRGMQAVVFALVATTFLTIYVTQPVLPVLKEEFGVTPGIASLTVSAVVLGIALANLPFGVLADRFPIRPIVLGGGAVVALTSLGCALTENIGLLVAARFVQGLFIPSMSTCLAAYLSLVRLRHRRRRLGRTASRGIRLSGGALAARIRRRRGTGRRRRRSRAALAAARTPAIGSEPRSGGISRPAGAARAPAHVR